MALMPLPSFHDLVPLAESFDLFQKSFETPALSSVAFTATRAPSRSGQFNSIGNHRYRGGSNGSTSGFSSILEVIPMAIIDLVDNTTLATKSAK